MSVEDESAGVFGFVIAACFRIISDDADLIVVHYLLMFRCVSVWFELFSDEGCRSQRCHVCRVMAGL